VNDSVIAVMIGSGDDGSGEWQCDSGDDDGSGGDWQWWMTVW
jgi:hypothetical protein